MTAPRRILYVDDNKDSCELAAVMLTYSDAECAVVAAETADEALRLIEKEPFDLYIFDYSMPDTSGIELCRYVRQFDRDTPILFYSGMAAPDDVTEGLAAGANEYLVKPNDLEKLSGTVKKFLSKMH